MPPELGAEGGIGEEPPPLLARLRHEGPPEGVVLEVEGRLGEVEAHLERPAADLRDDDTAGRLELRGVSEEPRRAPGREGVVEERSPRDELLARVGQAREEALLLELVVGRPDQAPRRHLDDPPLEGAERRGQLEQLLGVGEPARRRCPVAEEVGR